ncbi:hypothetical protein M5K25_008133 [Dendrobium thyrsiflorum]|uniref:Uncharacterized protein n=1 Tax=Dendrobium thyrsiflorum TaxID=117978 RepID=A0ABD0VF00_DENTH
MKESGQRQRKARASESVRLGRFGDTEKGWSEVSTSDAASQNEHLDISTCTPEAHDRAPPSLVATPTSSTTLHPSSTGKPCMGDPDVDHGFIYDEQGRVDILGSPFFDVEFGNDRTADEYVDQIIYQLSLAIEDRIPSGRWYIVSTPLTSLNLVTSLAATTLRATCLLVTSLSTAVHSILAHLVNFRVLSVVSRCCPFSLLPTQSLPELATMDQEHIQRTLDVILGKLGYVAQQIRDTQGELTDFRRQTGERLDNIERLGYPAIYTPSRPHSPYAHGRAPPSLVVTPTSSTTLHPSSTGKPCMGDLDVDHGFLYDDHGRVDIFGSPFFDVEFGNDRTADESNSFRPLVYRQHSTNFSESGHLSGGYYPTGHVSSSGVLECACDLPLLTPPQECE